MYLSDETKKALEKILGKSIEDVSSLDFDEEISYVKQKTGKDVTFSKDTDTRMVGRGNPLIIRRRISTMADVNKRLEKL